MKVINCIGLFLMIVLLVILVVPSKYYFFLFRRFDKDPRIAALQKEAIRLKIFTKISYIRNNAKELFGWTWYGSISENNDVIFKGRNGEYWIEYDDLKIQIRDCSYYRIYFNDSKVCELIVGDLIFGVSNNFKKVTAFQMGEWIDVFNEMYSKAIKGFPEESESYEDQLKRNWGL